MRISMTSLGTANANCHAELICQEMINVPFQQLLFVKSCVFSSLTASLRPEIHIFTLAVKRRVLLHIVEIVCLLFNRNVAIGRETGCCQATRNSAQVADKHMTCTVRVHEYIFNGMS